MTVEKLTPQEKKEIIEEVDKRIEKAIAKEDDLSLTERKEVIKEINKRLEKNTEENNAQVSKEVTKEINKKIKESISNKAMEFKNEFKKQLSTAIIAAFGLIIALSWRDVINDAVSGFAFVKEYGLLVTAIIMTIISVIAIFIISQWAKSNEVKK